MKRLLFLFSMVFLFLCTACQDKELIAEGKLTAITENTATIGETIYQTANGTTDFLLGDKIVIDGEKGYIYAQDQKLYVSKLNEEKVSFGHHLKIGYQIGLGIQAVLIIFVIFISLMSIGNEGLDEIDTAVITTFSSIMVIPTIFLIIGLNYPNSCFYPRNSVPLKILAYGHLTNKTDKTKTIKGVTWKISSEYPENSNKKIGEGKNYAVVQNGNDFALYEAESEKQIRQEITYANRHNKTNGEERAIIILGAFGLIALFGLFWKDINRFFGKCFKREKDSCEMYEEVNDDRQGYGRWD